MTGHAFVDAAADVDADAVVLGADAAGVKGWVGVVADASGFVLADVALTVAELIERAEAATGRPMAVVGVDIPIGLVAARSRAVDRLAREYVGPRRSSVFAAPHPEVVHLDDYVAVNAHLDGLGMPRISKQGFGLFARIREVAAIASDERVVEVFPEASFCAMAGGHLDASKKTWNGAARRRSLLAAADPPIVLPDDLGAAGAVLADDVLDAAAVAWSAWRKATGRAEAVGDPAERDPVTGRPIAMWV